MNVEEATVVAVAEEAIVAAEAEETIEDKDKSSHRLIGGNNKDEGLGRDSDSISYGDSEEISATAPREIPTTAPARQWGGDWKIPMNNGFTNKN